VETYTTHSPAQLIALGLQEIVAHLLDVKVMNLERRVRDIRLAAHLRRLHKEGMMVRELKATVDVEEASYGFPVP
jgi:hypothetical protein